MLAKSCEKNAVLTSGATAAEKEAFDNLLYIKAYGIDLSGYYVSTIFNSESFHHRIILKKDSDQSNTFIIDNPDGAENYCYYRTSDSFIVIGYKWSTHTTNVNCADVNNAHIKILDSVHSTDSMTDYILSKISKAESSAIQRELAGMDEIHNNINNFNITGQVTGSLTLAKSCITNAPYAVAFIDNDIFKCTVYSVQEGKTYRFKADNYRLANTYPSVVYTTTNVTTTGVTLSDAVVLYSADNTARNVDVVYHCHQNGYIVIAWITPSTELKLYETEKISRINTLEGRIGIIENKADDLSGKTIAILGDSIMALMATNVSRTNTTSYLGSDGNTYSIEQLTNINGKLCVTNDTSIICTVVNSNQEQIDNQNWDLLKTLTGAEDIINCGIGGAIITERPVITDYPYSSNDHLTNGLTNEVRMLKRIVQGGKEEPDCIIIWAGTNDVTINFRTDNFDDIMALNYSTLADDTLGRDYRRTLYGGLRYILETLYREYPYAAIIVFTPIQSSSRPYRTYERLSTISAAIKKMANRYGCVCVDALDEIGIVDLFEESGSETFLSDGVHPNVDGKQLMANFTAKKLNQLYFSKK